MEFSAVYKKQKHWYLGWVEELPGVNTQGRTLKEVKINLIEALRLILETNRELSRKTLPKNGVIKEPLSLVTHR